MSKPSILIRIYKDAYLEICAGIQVCQSFAGHREAEPAEAIAPDCLEADKELAEVYYATNRFGKAADTYAKFSILPWLRKMTSLNMLLHYS